MLVHFIVLLALIFFSVPTCNPHAILALSKGLSSGTCSTHGFNELNRADEQPQAQRHC